MSTFILSQSDVSKNYLTPNTLPAVRSAFIRNNESFLKFIELGDRALLSQNPLARFLAMMNIDPNWDEEYLIAIIGSTYKQVAARMDFNTIHMKGKNFTRALYPECNHNTFFVVPFTEPNDETISNYLNCDLKELVSFYPIYTTSKTHYWDISSLYNGIEEMSPKDIYSIVYIDPYALTIGYYRWLKNKVTAEGFSGHPSHYIIGYPVMNYYKYHNELVNLNYLHSADNLDVYEPSWNFIKYDDKVNKIFKWLNIGLMKTNVKSFTGFTKFVPVLNPDVIRDKMLFTYPKSDQYFPHLSWPYTLSCLANAERYMKFMNFMGYSDSMAEPSLKSFYKANPNILFNAIPDVIWKKHFISCYERIKENLL